MKRFPHVFFLGLLWLATGARADAVEPAASRPNHANTAPVDTPALWDAALFLPNSIPSEIFRNVEGTSLRNRFIPGSKITIGKIVIHFQYGNAQVSVPLEFETGHVVSSVQATGTFTFWRFERDRDGKNPRARFRLMLDSLKPTITAAGRTLEMGDLFDNAISRSLLSEVADYLSFSVPTPFDLEAPIGFQEDLSFKAGEAGEVRVRASAPIGTLAMVLTDLQVVFVPSGLWMCGQFNGSHSSTPKSLDLPPAQRWRVFETSSSRETIRLFVRGEFLAAIFNQLGELPADKRKAEISGRAHKGKLVDSASSSVWLSNDEEKGDLTLDPAATWAPAGLSVTCSYVANVTG